MNRTTQYNLYVQEKYVKNMLIPKLWQAILEKEQQKRKIQEVGALDSAFWKKGEAL